MMFDMYEALRKNRGRGDTALTENRNPTTVRVKQGFGDKSFLDKPPGGKFTTFTPLGDIHSEDGTCATITQRV